MKKIFIAGAAVVVVAATIISIRVNRISASLFASNVDALARLEQPNVNDCIKDPNYDCEALHPSDPDKDDYRKNARW